MNLTQRLLTALFELVWWGSAVAALLVGGVCTASPLAPEWAAPLFGLCSALAATAPVPALALLGATLPLFGNKPATPQALALTVVLSALHLGFSARRAFKSSEFAIRDTALQSRILLIALLYALASCLSLINFPWIDFVRLLRGALPSLTDFRTVGVQSFLLINSPEHHFQYSPFSVYLTALSVNLACVCAVQCRGRASGIWLLRSILAGLLLSLCAGILDYYGLIDLRKLRPLDPVVNPGDTEFRLQSFFAHSGWYAEYVTLAIPTSIVLLISQRAYWLRVVSILALLLVGEFVLILTFQRGGWVSYPLTLGVLWAAIYAVRRVERGETSLADAMRRSAFKIVCSLPITIVASLALITTINYVTSRSGSETLLSRYAQRFSDISRASDRTEFYVAGSLIGSLNPILGAGSESFAMQFEREFESAVGVFHDRIRLPLHGSAHNVYVQTFAGKGVLGLVFFLVLFGEVLARGTRASLAAAVVALNDRVTLLATASFAAALLIYGMVQEVFYVAPLQTLTFLFVGISAYGLRKAEGITVPSRALLALIPSALALSLIFDVHRYPSSHISGCYSPESDGAGGTFRWCGVRGTMAVHSDKDGVANLSLRFGPIPPDRSNATLVLTTDSDQKEIAVQPGTLVSISLASSVRAGEVLVGFRSAAYFIPAIDLHGQDTRTLSFQLLENISP